MIQTQRASTAFQKDTNFTPNLIHQLKHSTSMKRKCIQISTREEKYRFLKQINNNAKTEKKQERMEYESQYDQLVNKSMRLKFPPNYHVLMNKSRLQAFLCEKRQQDKKKRYGSQSNQRSVMAIPQGTLSIMINKNKKSKDFQGDQMYIPTKSKFKLKWKLIQWLIQNKSDQISQLCKFVKKLMKQKHQEDGQVLKFNQKQFEKLFNYVQLGGDQGLTDKLYFILETEKNGLIDSRDLVTSFEIIMNQSLDQIIINFLEMCNEDENDVINPNEFFNIMKFIFQNSCEKIKLNMAIKKIFRFIESKNLQCTKKNVIQMSINDQKLKQILYDSIDNVKKIDFLIENDLEPPFYINNTISNTNGTYYRQQDCLINLMKTNYQYKKAYDLKTEKN